MNTEAIVKAIDEQIAQLQNARELLAGSRAPIAVSTQRGRPKGSMNRIAAAPAITPAKAPKRVMSAEGRARIAAAQKLRWAKQSKAAGPAKAARTNSVLSEAKETARKKSAAKKTAAAEP